VRTLGILGGLGPESTIAYYRGILQRVKERTGEDRSPPLVIVNLDVSMVLRIVAQGHLPETAEYLLEGLDQLAGAGADFALIASNTPHIVFDVLLKESPIPLLSIVEATAADARAQGLKRLALLGTRSTMQGGFYERVFEPRGMAIVRPAEADLAWIDERYRGELVRGTYREATREGMLGIIDRLAAEQGIDAAILGGTELPLLIRDGARGPVKLLDTARLHVERAVDEILR
jgi:aspartate racemase